MYGYTTSEEITTKQGGVFGLNSGAFVTKFEYNPNSGAKQSQGDGIDLTVQIGDREYSQRFFPVSKVYRSGKDKDGNKLQGEITDTTSEEYKEAVEAETKRLSALLTDVVRCFVPSENVEAALATPIASFKDYAIVLQNLVRNVPNFSSIPVDVFLEYQYKPTGENTKTYLTLPKNVKQGSFIVKSLGSGFTRVEDIDSIRFANKEGITHPFKRSKWYAESAYSNMTDLSKGNEEMGSSDSTGDTW